MVRDAIDAGASAPEQVYAHHGCAAAIAHAESVGDYVSRNLFWEILESEEEHIDWLETQIGLIDRLGEANYLRAAMGSLLSER